jgi:hypothetical protein
MCNGEGSLPFVEKAEQGGCTSFGVQSSADPNVPPRRFMLAFNYVQKEWALAAVAQSLQTSSIPTLPARRHTNIAIAAS